MTILPAADFATAAEFPGSASEEENALTVFPPAISPADAELPAATAELEVV
ncbi:hypothetical protein AGMMS50222_07950 [Endomicrobiia bacterium]|nr:hypothetical protein AGMMS49556_07980 [Endomicrobiia bacterium]GHT75983.1 hypothetical protein AGMMS50222_07950 [Endomicrobiia bacterium]